MGAIFDLNFHLVFVTKYRRKALSDPILLVIEKQFRKILDKNVCYLNEFNGEADHIHALIKLHPNITPAKLVNSLKTTSNRAVYREFQRQLRKFYWHDNLLWSKSYCMVSAGGAPLAVIKQYIQKQDRPRLSIPH